ncbi:hypothetical protein [Clostridium manihotivorum]|uniref:Uncharacterized protein n=1 Tax=Clostridium manihotivorum TaxID=2320868 RepID=A0A410DTR8_9CLOT|nr:hypothetical protein [Clostridium manihotivorum]QAA32398.1 hypothetical protein C1I91_12520 [Clostridium manihotivorum]
MLDNFKKENLNDKIVSIINFLLWILLVFVVVSTIIMFLKSKRWFYVILGVLLVGGTLVNIKYFRGLKTH